MNCPNCNETLRIIERHGVELDYCAKCRGIWLNRSELDKIITELEQDAEAQAEQKQLADYFRERHRMTLQSNQCQSKKSLVREFFDWH